MVLLVLQELLHRWCIGSVGSIKDEVSFVLRHHRLDVGHTKRFEPFYPLAEG